MFGRPTKLPRNANILHPFCTYLIKDDKTKKVRCVCNRSPRMTGSTTFAETYAGSLDQIASKVFLVAASVNKCIVVGVDAANVFAEAGAPKVPPFVNADKPFRKCYRTRDSR